MYTAYYNVLIEEDHAWIICFVKCSYMLWENCGSKEVKDVPYNIENSKLKFTWIVQKCLFLIIIDNSQC